MRLRGEARFMKSILLLAALLFAACDDSPSRNAPTVIAASAPHAVTHGDQTVNEGSTVTLDGTSSTDADGDIASHAWDQIEGPPVALTGAATAVATFTAGDVSDTTVLRFRLTVRDESGLTDTAIVAVIVVDLNPAPVVDAGANETADALAVVTLGGSARDDGSVAALQWTQVDGPDAGAITGADQLAATVTAPDVDQERTITFQLTATDNEGKTGRDTVRVTVSPVAAALLFRQQPATPLRNAVWTPVTVEVLNTSGVRVVGGAAASIEIALTAAREDGTDVTADIIGTLAATAELGRSTFADLSYPRVTNAGNGVLLTASATSLPPVASPVIDVVWPSELPGALLSDDALAATEAAFFADDLLVAGSFSGTADFDFAGSGTGDTMRSATDSSRDGFLARYATDGSPVWVKTITGVSDVSVSALSVTANAIFLAVEFEGDDSVTFPHDTAPVEVSGSAGDDIACARLAGDGNTEWAAAVAGSGDEYARAIAVDSTGAVALAGAFTGSDTDFDPDPVDTALDSSTGSNPDGFVVKLDASGNYVWHLLLDGPSDTEDAATAVGHQAASGDVLVGGFFGPHSFLFRLDAIDATEKVNAAFAGSTASDSVQLWILEEGPANTVLVAGSFSGTVDFDPRPDVAVDLTASADPELFVAQLDMAGELSWVHRITAVSDMEVVGLSVRSSDLVLVGTATGLADFDPDGSGVAVDFGTVQGSWMVSRSLTTGAPGWTRAWQNPVDLFATALAASGTRILVTGSIGAGVSVDLDPTDTVVSVTVPSNREGAFAVMLDSNGDVAP
jgi:hypothetical protein